MNLYDMCRTLRVNHPLLHCITLISLGCHSVE